MFRTTISSIWNIYVKGVYAVLTVRLSRLELIFRPSVYYFWLVSVCLYYWNKTLNYKQYLDDIVATYVNNIFLLTETS